MRDQAWLLLISFLIATVIVGAAIVSRTRMRRISGYPTDLLSFVRDGWHSLKRFKAGSPVVSDSSTKRIYRARIDKLFDRAFYIHANPKASRAKIEPLEHFLHSGAYDGKLGWREEAALEWQRPFLYDCQAAAAATSLFKISPSLKLGDIVELYVSSRGNFFFKQIQALMAAALNKIGVVVRLMDDTSMPGSAALRIVIAPHEFFYLGNGRRLASDPQFVSAILLNTEQLHTRWFAKALPHILKAPFVLDMSLQNAAAMAKMGIAAAFLPLGYDEDFELFGPREVIPRELAVDGVPEYILRSTVDFEAPLSSRPLDLLFVGMVTPRREAFFSQAASRLADNHYFIHLVRADAPLLVGAANTLTGEAFSGLAQRSKLLLNVHHADAPYFEWHRLAHFGLAQRCCVVTETSTRVPHLNPGEHYFEEELSRIPDLIDWLLQDERGREAADRVSKAGFMQFRRRYNLRDGLRKLFFEEASSCQ